MFGDEFVAIHDEVYALADSHPNMQIVIAKAQFAIADQTVAQLPPDVPEGHLAYGILGAGLLGAAFLGLRSRRRARTAADHLAA